MQLLQQQESNFKTIVEMLVNNMNTRIDQLTRENQELKSRLQFSQKDIDDLKYQNKIILSGRLMACGETKTIQEKLLKTTEKADYLEG